VFIWFSDFSFGHRFYGNSMPSTIQFLTLAQLISRKLSAEDSLAGEELLTELSHCQLAAIARLELIVSLFYM